MEFIQNARTIFHQSFQLQIIVLYGLHLKLYHRNAVRMSEVFYSIQDNEVKRCQGLTLDKMNQVDKKLSPISQVTINDIKFPYFPLG